MKGTRVAESSKGVVDEYIAEFPVETQRILKKIRRIAKKAAPGCAEKISYQIPTITLDGKNVAHFAGWSNHVSIYPVPSTNSKLQKDVAGYVAGKGTLKFPLSEPIPYDLIERVLEQLVVQHEMRTDVS